MSHSETVKYKIGTFFLDGPCIKIPAKENYVGFRLIDVGGHELLDLRLAVVRVGVVVQVWVGVGGGVGDKDVHRDVGRMGKPETKISHKKLPKMIKRIAVAMQDCTPEIEVF